MLMLDIAVVNTALSDIAADLDSGTSGLQWVIDAYTLPLAALVVTAGSLADRFGRRRLFLLGLAVFTVASGACAFAPSILVLDVARAVQGTGAAVMFAVSLAALSVAFPRPDQRMRALAAYGATMAASFAVGPLVGGALTTWWGWPAIFLVNLPLGVFAMLIVRRSVAESTDPDAPPVDWPGLFTLSTGLSFVVVALLRGNEDGWSSTIVVGAFVAAGGLLVAFVAVEARVHRPMVPLRLFRNPAFTGAQIAAVGLSASLFALWFYLTLYLQQILGLSAIAAGLVFLPGTLVNLFVASAMASLGQRMAPGRVIAGGSALVAGGLLLLVLVSTETSWWWFLPGLLVAMVGTGALNPVISGVALGSVPPAQSGLAAGVNDMFRQAGIAVGIAAYGAIAPVDLAFDPATHGRYVEYLYDALWVGAIVALLCGLVAGRLVGRQHRRSAVALDERDPVGQHEHDRLDLGEILDAALARGLAPGS
jgi:EmrB/QacA subfamily drug resistance transporter